MSNFLMIVACLLSGMLLQRGGRLPMQAHTAVNAIILHVSLPAVTLRYLHGFRFELGQLLPVLMPWALFLIGAAGFFIIGRWLRVPAATIGGLTLAGGFGNTSFVGLPMIETLYGADGLGLGLLIDQLGSYLALSTVGITAAALYATDGPIRPRTMLRKVATFPPFIALVAALVLASVPFPSVLEHTLTRIGDTLAPLALLSVGMQLRFDELRQHRSMLCLGLGFKLLVCPGLVVALLWLSGADADMTNRVSVIEASMPPMIGAAIVASQANLAPKLVSIMVGLGIPLGLLTAPAWLWLFGALSRLP